MHIPDEMCIRDSYLTEFDGKPFQSVSKVDESLEKLADEVDESAKEAEKALTPVSYTHLEKGACQNGHLAWQIALPGHNADAA